MPGAAAELYGLVESCNIDNPSTCNITIPDLLAYNNCTVHTF